MRTLIVVLAFSLLGSGLFAESDLVGTWNTGRENTLVRIYEIEKEYYGEIISSDNRKVEIGTQILKDFEKVDDKWKADLFFPKMQRWFTTMIELEDDTLTITISTKTFKRSKVWTRVSPVENQKLGHGNR